MASGVSVTVVEQLADRIRERALALVMVAADATVTATQNAAPVGETGNLRESIAHAQPVVNDPYITCTIEASAEYAAYVDRGTGIFGPSGAPITGNPFLAFRWPRMGPGIFVFRSVKGSPAKNFFTEPMPQRWAAALADNAGSFAS